MQIVSDLHIHSRFSRATSHEINIQNLEKWAKIKGISLLGTGDFTHPLWLRELKQQLQEDGSGILRTKSGFPFVLQNEISLMYSQDGKSRRIHLVLLAPSFEIVDQINEWLAKHGRLDYDGRPIFGLTCPVVTEALKKISNDIEIIPAHCLTPWFGIFGSKSGFDSVEECFKDKSKEIYALETGLSADPEMIWRIPKARDLTLVSSSDSHSFWPWRLGREATIFDLSELSYKNIIKAIRTQEGYSGTIEVNPAYGKYHFDGHRFCHFSCEPKEAIKGNNICPVCGKPLTIGVMHRVEELADKSREFRPENTHFKTLLPLHEILAKIMNTAVSSKKVWAEYSRMIEAFKNEFNILLNVPVEKLRKITTEKITEAIIKNRKGKIKVRPGFDGQYGKTIIETEKQETLV